MKQKTIKTPVKSKENPLDTIKKEFEKVKTPATRVVTLRYKSCCGCGCDWVDVERTVPYDSDLQDGTKITDLQEGDRMVD